MLNLDPDSGYLPPGTHLARLEEVERAFGAGPRRRMLMKGLRHVVRRLQERGVATIWIDGSFLSAKMRPGDVDVVYEPPAGADTTSWGLLAFENRKDLKATYRVDLWPHPSPQPSKRGVGTDPLIDWFRYDRADIEKGVVQLVLDNDQEQQ